MQRSRSAGRTAVRRACIGAAVVLLAMGADARQSRVVGPTPPRADATPSTGTAAITGTVVDAATNRPIAGAIVALEIRPLGAPRQSHSQVTTPTGRFAFVDLPASDAYLLTAGKPGYLSGGYRQTDSSGPAPITLQDGQWMREVHISLPHPGSISGTVLDERGEPVVGSYVRVLVQVPIAGRTQWLAGAVAVTDDRGAYRIAGLGPGKYLVSVPSVQATLPAGATIRSPGAWSGTSASDLRSAADDAKAEKLVVDAGGGQQLVVGRYASPPPTADGQPTAYPIVFYPGVSTPGNATPVELGVSEDRPGIDFQLQPVPTAQVSGLVQGPPDAVGNLLVRLIPVGLEDLGQGSEAATTVTRSDGRFTFLDVPAGSYLVEVKHAVLELTYTSLKNAPTLVPAPVPFPTSSAAAGGVSAAPAGVEFSSLQDWEGQNYWGQARVEVDGRRIDDLVLPLRRSVRMIGRIEWVPGARPAGNPPRLTLEPADGRPSLGMPSPPFRPSGPAFTIDGLMPGRYVLRLFLGGGAVESVTWNGRDYTDRPFDASDGRDITGVVVTLTDALSSISGAVSDAGMTSTSGAAVMAFPVDPERWSNYGLNPRRLRSVLTTTDGRFRLEGLPPGEYYLLAVPATQELAWLDPAFLASHAARASRVKVERSDTTLAGIALSLVK